MIPKVFNFIYVFDENGSTRDFNIHHYLSILTNYKVNNPDRIVLHTNDSLRLISNSWIKKLISIIGDRFHINSNWGESDRYTSSGKRYEYMAHWADYIRLNILYNEGGVYCDLDCIALTPMPESWFLEDKVKWGIESDGSETAICNNVIVAPKDNPFIVDCLKILELEYDPLIAVPGTSNWAVYSVMKPYELYKSNLDRYDSVDILPSGTFQPYHQYYDDTEKLFFLDRFDEVNKPEYYELHTWETRNWVILKNLSERYFKESQSTYAKAVRHALGDQTL